jgi:hypothetical protein
MRKDGIQTRKRKSKKSKSPKKDDFNEQSKFLFEKKKKKLYKSVITVN